MSIFSKPAQIVIRRGRLVQSAIALIAEIRACDQLLSQVTEDDRRCWPQIVRQLNAQDAALADAVTGVAAISPFPEASYPPMKN